MALLGVLLMEFGDFAMLRRMLRGIKARAESLATSPARCRARRSAILPVDGGIADVSSLVCEYRSPVSCPSGRGKERAGTGAVPLFDH